MIGYAGIDPGVKGAIWVLDESGYALGNHSFADRWTLDQICNLLIMCVVDYKIAHCYIENVGMRPGQGRSSNAKLVANRHICWGLMRGRMVQVHHVIPTEWQHTFALGGKQGPPGCSKSQESTARKHAHWRHAKIHIPDIAKEDADGYLIARHGWLKETVANV